jgi:hypothetical protein
MSGLADSNPSYRPDDPRLPPCIPHGVADCPICLAEAERIVDERLADSNPSSRLHARCTQCGRGAEACEWCHNIELRDWEAICDCGLYDLGNHLLACLDRANYRYVVVSNYESAGLQR